MRRCLSRAFILLSVLQASWIWSLVSDINLEKFLLFFQIFLLSFFLFLLPLERVCPLHVCYSYCSCPTVLGYSLLFSDFVLLDLHFGSFFWRDTLKLRDSFLRNVQSTNKPIHFLYHFLKISSSSFWFFLRSSISLFTLPSCFCMLPTLLDSLAYCLLLFKFLIW